MTGDTDSGQPVEAQVIHQLHEPVKVHRFDQVAIRTMVVGQCHVFSTFECEGYCRGSLFFAGPDLLIAGSLKEPLVSQPIVPRR